MNKTKYFVIRNHNEPHALVVSVHVVSVHDELALARAKAEEYAMASPGTRYMIAAETQSIIGQVQVNWTDK